MDFERAFELICAHSPQAKGQLERANRISTRLADKKDETKENQHDRESN